MPRLPGWKAQNVLPVIFASAMIFRNRNGIILAQLNLPGNLPPACPAAQWSRQMALPLARGLRFVIMPSKPLPVSKKCWLAALGRQVPKSWSRNALAGLNFQPLPCWMGKRRSGWRRHRIINVPMMAIKGPIRVAWVRSARPNLRQMICANRL